MAYHRVTYRYWKVKDIDLNQANRPDVDGIIVSINGTGAAWQDGACNVKITKGTPEWDHLINHIGKLNCFDKYHEHVNGKKVPGKLRKCIE